jgi:hypothetical protein
MVHSEPESSIGEKEEREEEKGRKKTQIKKKEKTLA